MNLQKSIAIGFAVTALFASFGCGGGNQSGSGSSTSISAQQKKSLDEAEIKRIMKKLESPDIKDKKEAYPIEKLPFGGLMKTPLKDDLPLFEFNSKTRFDNLSITDLKQDGDFASAQLSFVNEDKKTINERFYFRKVDGKWCADFFPIKTAKPLKVSNYDETQLEAAANLGYTYKNEPVIIFDVRSKTATKYMVGRALAATFILITDTGEFPMQNTDILSAPQTFSYVSSEEASRFELPFKGATGTLKALRIVGFNKADNRGIPVSHEPEVVTFTFSE